MTEARAISAQLVDIRNVGTHKVVKLTLHAPEEHALRIMELFGWPTGVNPVPVAIARLQPKGGDETATGDERALSANTLKSTTVDQPLPPAPTVLRNTAGEAERRDYKPSQLAGMFCEQRKFRLFLSEKFECKIPTPAEAAEIVRAHCDVQSRSQITKDNAGWSDILLAYRLWEREAEIVPA